MDNDRREFDDPMTDEALDETGARICVSLVCCACRLEER